MLTIRRTTAMLATIGLLGLGASIPLGMSRTTADPARSDGLVVGSVAAADRDRAIARGNTTVTITDADGKVIQAWTVGGGSFSIPAGATRVTVEPAPWTGEVPPTS